MTSKVEFGDFQTPDDTAMQICNRLRRHDMRFSTIIEPTCGIGNFLVAAMKTFPQTNSFAGYDINKEYLASARARCETIPTKLKSTQSFEILEQNFFSVDWQELVSKSSQPILFIGNPPWVTNSGLGVIKGNNLPEKSNFQGLRGLDALTGKSNFDISEWMLLWLLKALQGKDGMVAMLCKTSVARKIIKYAAEHSLFFSDAELIHLNSKEIFNVSVDACFFIFRVQNVREYTCAIYESLNDLTPSRTFGIADGHLVADTALYENTRHLEGISPHRWRSGVKHDCSSVMELKNINTDIVNGFGETLKIENDLIYPFLKSSDLSKDQLPLGKRSVLVTQKYIGEPTDHIREKYPLLWEYLNRHDEYFNKRKSSIYKNKPKFSIFGIGEYSFAPWKIAISGLYKTSRFSLIPPFNGKPVMLDDTCYFIPCQNEEEATVLVNKLNGHAIQAFIKSVIFWDAKRPISADLLQRLNLNALDTMETT